MSELRTRISNGWYRMAGRRISGQRARISNWRNRRTLERGRRPRITQAADQVRSRIPVYRDRVNRATGRPHRDDVSIGRVVDASLTRLAPGCARRHAAHDQAARDRSPAGREDRTAGTLDRGPGWEDRAYRSYGTPDPFAVRTAPPRSPRLTGTRPALAGRSAGDGGGHQARAAAVRKGRSR